jgi:pSer/pThr/pTyr-binding forkhead associated (FHA) protein
MPNLFLVRYPEAPIPVSITGKTTIGRSNLNSTVLMELRVSRFHAQIEWQEFLNYFILTDLGSANGTYLNGKKIRPRELHPLKDWDKIRIASTVFTARFVDDPQSITDEFQELTEQASHDKTELIELSKITSLQQQPAFSGDLEHLCAIEIFQILEAGAKTGLLTIKTNIGDGSYTILKGKVLTAQFKDLLGEQAVFEILKCTRGSFEFLPELVDIKNPQIELATSMLLMEGCRLLDEANLQASRVTAPRPALRKGNETQTNLPTG